MWSADAVGAHLADGEFAQEHERDVAVIGAEPRLDAVAAALAALGGELER